MTSLAWTHPDHPWMRDGIVLELPAEPRRAVPQRSTECDWCGASTLHRNANAIYGSRSCQRRARYHDRSTA